MIDLVANTLLQNIQALPFIDRYGGVVRPVAHRVETDEGVFVTKYYPIGNIKNGEFCGESGQTNIVEPNDQFKSVSYIEQVGGSTIQIDPALYNAKQKFWRFTERFRFVCWLRFSQFTSDAEGTTPYVSTTRFEAEVMNALTGDYTIEAADNEGISGEMSVSPIRVIESNPRDVFGKYDYQEKEWAFVHPYGFFAVEFETEIIVPSGCIAAMETGIPVNC